MCRRGRMDISYYTINQTGRARPRVCWKTAFFRVNAYLGKEFVDGDSGDGPSGQCETGLDVVSAALPELLAPAGGLDQMLAAIAAGTDAIYAGLGGFNARVSAHGFTDDEFARGCAVAHAHGVRVYVTLNVFVFDDELSDAVALGAHALELGADALIVADAGLACALSAAIPGVEIHLSTQAGAHSRVPCGLPPMSWGSSA